ncbi:MAG: sulfotransferase [Rhodothermales bacterium]|nr:sulfotransferase [Rhodothermales bacterium]
MQFDEIVREFVDRVEIPDLDKVAVIDQLLSMPRNLRSPYKGLMDYWAKAQGKIRWGEKTPGNLFYADVINEMFPDAVFIHMIRDPRAGVYSMEQVWFFPEDVIFNALSRHKHMTVGRSILEGAVPADRILTLRYEDLVADPVPVVKRVCEFVGEAYHEQMMSYYKGADQHMRSDAAADFNALATRPISASETDKWRSGLTRAELEAIELICGEEMSEFRYERVTSKASPLVKLRVRIKEAYWQKQESKNRDNRHFTVRYKMFSGIQRRLGIRPQRRKPVGVA